MDLLFTHTLVFFDSLYQYYVFSLAQSFYHVFLSRVIKMKLFFVTFVVILNTANSFNETSLKLTFSGEFNFFPLSFSLPDQIMIVPLMMLRNAQVRLPC